MKDININSQEYVESCYEPLEDQLWGTIQGGIPYSTVNSNSTSSNSKTAISQDHVNGLG